MFIWSFPAMRENQKFLPQVPTESDQSSKNQDAFGKSGLEKYFVPRQKILIITCDDKKVETNVELYEPVIPI